MSVDLQNPTVKKKTIFISCGEKSGDLHASSLIHELKKINSSSTNFIGLGGDLMKTEGMDLLHHQSELSVTGYTDVLKRYPFFKRILNECIKHIKEKNPVAVILVDYPGFNLRLAEELRKFYRGKIIYYISPQIWAWNQKRVKQIKANVDKMLVVFPFEEAFYKKHKIDAVYIGHPLVTRIDEFLNNNRKEKKVFGESKVLTILPGSREHEIKNHLPILLDTAKQLKKEFDIEINISKLPELNPEYFEKFCSSDNDFKITEQNTYELILNSDAVMTKAGTSTVECALIGSPFLIFYKTNEVNYRLLKPLVKVQNLGMVNILAERNIVREFIQMDFTVNNLLLECRKLLTENNYRNEMIENFKEIRKILGSENAAKNAATIINELII